MTTDLFGPALVTAANVSTSATTVRPADDRIYGAVDTWFKDCSSPTLRDGTAYRAAFFNMLLAELRTLARANGLQRDGVTPVLADANADQQILTSLLFLMQRGLFSVAHDTGSANAVAISLNPAPPELVDGMQIVFKAAATNTGATAATINNQTMPVTSRASQPLMGGEIVVGGWVPGRIAIAANGATTLQISASAAFTGTEGVTIVNDVAELAYLSLVEEDTLNQADLVAFYAVEAEGGQASGHHYRTTLGTLAAFVNALAKTQAAAASYTPMFATLTLPSQQNVSPGVQSVLGLTGPASPLFSLNNGAMTIASPGLYLLQALLYAVAAFPQNEGINCEGYIIVNGTTVGGDGDNLYCANFSGSQLNPSAAIVLAAGDVVEVATYINGSPYGISAAVPSCRFSMLRIA